MQTFILNTWEKIRYQYRGVGFAKTIIKIAYKILSPIYRHDTYYIAVETIHTDIPGANKINNSEIECVVHEKSDRFRLCEYKTIPSIPMNKIKKLLENPNSISIIAFRQDRIDPEKKIVGFRICEPGIFYAPGVKFRVSPAILAIIHTEVLPKYRGQKINAILWKATYEICQQREFTKAYGLISIHNYQSLKSHGKLGEIKAEKKFELFSFAFGLHKRYTPPNEVKKLLES
ncbi:MAG: GNAT family N-acetyltransferase [Thermodesulfobacteriota bacterium]